MIPFRLNKFSRNNLFLFVFKLSYAHFEISRKKGIKFWENFKKGKYPINRKPDTKSLFPNCAFHRYQFCLISLVTIFSLLLFFYPMHISKLEKKFYWMQSFWLFLVFLAGLGKIKKFLFLHRSQLKAKGVQG